MTVGLEDVSAYPALFAELLSRGWTEADCAALAGATSCAPCAKTRHFLAAEAGPGLALRQALMNQGAKDSSAQLTLAVSMLVVVNDRLPKSIEDPRSTQSRCGRRSAAAQSALISSRSAANSEIKASSVGSSPPGLPRRLSTPARTSA